MREISTAEAHIAILDLVFEYRFHVGVLKLRNVSLQDSKTCFASFVSDKVDWLDWIENFECRQSAFHSTFDMISGQLYRYQDRRCPLL